MKRLGLVCVFLSLVLCGFEAMPLTKIPPKEMELFMKRFGYLESGSGPDSADSLYSEEGFREAVRQMQRFGGLPDTGELDEGTLNLTRARRCGVPDVVVKPKRTRRFVVGSKAWRKRTITYFMANWPPEMDMDNTRQRLQKALDLWSGATTLKFKPRQSMDADLIIAWGRGGHGDGYSFDGKGGILAHAFFPYEHGSYGGDIHFDDDENWIDASTKTKETDGVEESVDFYTVAAHEIGHSLGLAHSTVRTSIMFPYYKGYDNQLQLDYDDIMAMYAMYVLDGNFEDEPGLDDNLNSDDEPQPTDPEDDATDHPGYTDENKASPTSTESARRVTDVVTINPVTSTSQPDEPKGEICEGSIDAVSLLRGELFVFKESRMWRFVERDTMAAGYPVDFHVFFRIPRSIQRIDAVYERPGDFNIVFFTGNQFWVFDGNAFTEDSPRPLTTLGLPSDLDKIDAALVWAKNKRTYLFRGQLYWRMDQSGERAEQGYPQRIARWRGVPSSIDSAFTWKDGKTYFFKDKHFWCFDNKNRTVEANYPQQTAKHWFGCQSEEMAKFTPYEL